jgi:hypothetical protein
VFRKEDDNDWESVDMAILTPGRTPTLYTRWN